MHVYSLLNFELGDHSSLASWLVRSQASGKLCAVPGLGEYQCTFVSFMIQDRIGTHP